MFYRKTAYFFSVGGKVRIYKMKHHRETQQYQYIKLFSVEVADLVTHNVHTANSSQTAMLFPLLFLEHFYVLLFSNAT